MFHGWSAGNCSEEDAGEAWMCVMFAGKEAKSLVSRINQFESFRSSVVSQ